MESKAAINEMAIKYKGSRPKKTFFLHVQKLAFKNRNFQVFFPYNENLYFLNGKECNYFWTAPLNLTNLRISNRCQKYRACKTKFHCMNKIFWE